MVKPCILVTGAGGQLGSALIQSAPDRLDVIGHGSGDLDITAPDQVRSVLDRHQPTLIINAAAYTAVDPAEQDVQSAFNVNRDGVEILALEAAARDIPLIHFSTDYVFDGTEDEPYTELDLPNPLSVYGMSKHEGEAVLLSTCEKALILRTSWVFGVAGANFVKTILRLAQDKERLTIIDDQRSAPTSADSLTRVVWRLVAGYIAGEKMVWGVFHFSGQPEVSWYEFAKEIIRQASERALIASAPELVPIRTEEYPTAATRPRHSALDCSRILSVYGVEQPDWRVDLCSVLDALVTHPG